MNVLFVLCLHYVLCDMMIHLQYHFSKAQTYVRVTRLQM